MGCPAEVEIGDNLVFSVCTHDPDTGVLTDADAVPAYRVYEDETATPILTGNMAKLDDAGTTGFYTELIACTTANGFENGKSYTVYIEATVDSDTGGIAYSFKAVSKKAREGADSDTLETLSDQLDTIDDFLDTEVAAILADTAELQTDWTNGGRLDLLLDAVKAKTDNLPSSIPKAVALANFSFGMFSNQDHVTPVAALSVTSYISKDGAAFAATTNSVSAISNGAYKITLTATEMDADVIILRFTSTGADDVLITIKTDS